VKWLYATKRGERPRRLAVRCVCHGTSAALILRPTGAGCGRLNRQHLPRPAVLKRRLSDAVYRCLVADQAERPSVLATSN
jgi:hypothetical protein